MEYEVEDDVLGRVPKFGAIFMCNLSTKRECFRRKLLGLPSAKANFVRQIKAGMVLFLFEFERRELYGVFRACSDGSMNIVPHAFSSSGKQFPAQVRFTPVWYCNPLCEDEFQDAIIDNYFAKKKFNFGLSEEQVHRLLRLFSSRKMEKPPRPSGRQTSQPMVEGKRITGDDNVFLSNNRAEKFDEEEDSLDSAIHTKYPGNSSSKSGRLDGDRFLKSGGTENDLNVNNSHGYDILTKQLSASLGKRRRDDDDKVSMQDRIAYDRHLDQGLVQVVPIDHPGDSLGKPERVAEERKFLLSDRVETSHSVESNTGPTVRPEYFWDSLTKVRRATDDDRFSIGDIVGDERTSDTTLGLITSTEHFENPAIKAGIPSDDRRFLNDYRVESHYNLDNFPKPVVSADYCVNHSGKRRTSDDGVLFSNGRTEIEQHVDNCSRSVILAKYLEKGMGKVRKEIEGDKFLTSVRMDSPSEPFANRLDYVRRANDHDRFLARVSRENEQNVDNGVGPVISTLHSPYPSDEVRLVADDLLKIGREHNMENSCSLPMSNNLCQSRQNPSFYLNDPVLETDYLLCQDQPKPHSAIPSMEQNTFDFSYPTSRDAGVTRTVPYYPEVPDINRIRSSSVAVGCTSCSAQDFPPHLSSTGNLFAASLERSSPYRFEARDLSRHLDVACGFADEVPLPTTPNHYTGSDFRTSSSLLSAEYHQKLNPTFLEFDNHAVMSQGRHENKISHHDTSQAYSIDNASFNSNMGYLHSGSSHEKSNNRDSRYYESPKVMPTDPKSKRTSVFARLTSASEVSVKENDTDLQYDECDIGASVDEVMDTLYQSLSHRVMKVKKSSLVTKNDIEHDNLKMTTSKKKNDADHADQVIEENCNDILKETRVVNFKRRSETKKNQDRTKAKTSAGTLEHETKGSVQKLECEGLEAKQHKRRKLVRPVFGKTEQLDEGLSSDGSLNSQPSHMDSFCKDNTGS